MFNVACSEEHNYYDVNVENVTTGFNLKDLIVEEQSGFKAKGPTPEYTHLFPTSYVAYFVTKETKGQYTAGQTVIAIPVTPGNNTITLPKLDYDVYVTNYNKAGQWYTWNDAINQLPQSSSVLYLYGKGAINYNVVTTGSVTVQNPYAAVMIKTSNYIPSAPMFYNDSQYYVPITGTSSTWHLRYLRSTTTNTMVPLNIPGHSSTQYTLNKNIVANNVYKYTINGNVGDVGGDFTVDVEEFVGEHDETIDIL